MPVCRQCWTKVSPANEDEIHNKNCGHDISRCPDGYPTQFSNYCEKGPVNKVCIENEPYPCKNGSYRNSFCQHCWKDESFQSLVPPEQLPEGKLIDRYKVSH